MPKDATVQMAQSSKGMWSLIQEAPWYAPVLITLITSLVIGFKAFLNYLNKKAELQIIENKHIRECNLRMSMERKKTTRRVVNKGENNAK